MIEVRPGGRRRIDRVLAPEYVRDLGQLDLAEVRARRDDAAQEETDLSYLRRLLHGRIDIVKAEQKRRLEGGSSSVVARSSATFPESTRTSGRSWCRPSSAS